METITAFTEEETQKKISDFLDAKKIAPVCPVRDVLHFVGDKWAMFVMVNLGQNKTMRFNELKHAIDGISQKMLTVTLRDLESFGLVDRKIFAQIPPKVEYTITETGEEYLRHMMVMLDWACQNSERIMKNRMR